PRLAWRASVDIEKQMSKQLTSTATLAMTAAALALVAVSNLAAISTTGGVNWLDPLGYTKPAFRPIAEPAPGANQYWVDLGTGSGTACTSSLPCSLTTVQGKPGTHGDGGG